MQKQLLTLRIIWAAMLMGEVSFMFIALVLGPKMNSQVDVTLLAQICAGMLLVMVPTAFVIRGVVYRKGTQDGGVSPAAYMTGNIIFWAMCEGVSFFGLVVTLLS